MRIRTSFLAALGLTAMAAAILRAADNAPKAAPPPDSTYGKAQALGKVDDKALKELSGLAPSRRTPGYLWTHNDSGGAPELYALDMTAKRAATFKITNATNSDWEDLAGYVDKAGKSWLFIADTGNSPSRKQSLRLYRVAEPEIVAGSTKTSEGCESFPFRYPDGAYDCEALAIDPASGVPYLFTKSASLGNACSVFRFPMPLQAGKEVVLERLPADQIKSISNLPMVTGASASPDGKHLAIRTYLGVFELDTSADGSFASALAGRRRQVAFPFLVQAEAVSYLADGSGLVTVAEGENPTLYQMKRNPAATGN